MAAGNQPSARWWRALGQSWTWRMAWRDSRSQRKRLFIFSLSIISGISALVTLHLLRTTLQRGLEVQAKALLGADLHVSSREPIPEQAMQKIAARARGITRETSFNSMVYFPTGDGARLVLIRALEGAYPYYGRVETEPAGAWARLRTEPGILMEPALLEQFSAKVGDKVKIGDLELPILGALTKPPPHSGRYGSFAPEAFVRLSDLPATGLLGKTGLVYHHVYTDQPNPKSVQEVRDQLAPLTELKSETPENRREALGHALDDAEQFLSIVALAALMLGAIGVAGAIHAHVSRRITSVAILRCLGCPGEAAFAIYLAQAAVLGLAGALVGALLGVALHAIVMATFGNILPVRIDPAPDWGVVAQVTAAGLAVCGGFALLPLLRVSRIPPAAALRDSEPPGGVRQVWPVWLFLFALLTGLNLMHGARWVWPWAAPGGPWAWPLSLAGTHWLRALTITGAQGLAFLLLALTARGLVFVARRLARPSWPYLLRQGVSNLHRPHNQTLLFLLSLGLGTFLLATILLAKNLLLERTSVQRIASSPNIYLVDVQTDQLSGVEELLRSQHLPVLESAPLVTMRIQEIKGVPVRELQKKGEVPKWALQREFRSTYRRELSPTEKIVAGQWLESSPSDPNAPVPLSLEKEIAGELHVKVGDEITLDVLSVPIHARITSLREIDWSRFNLNFFMVFPPGVLEGAPSFDVVTTRVPDSAGSGELQRVLVKQFPNISAIDLSTILQTVRSILDKLTRIVSLLAGFAVLAALPIVAGTLLNGRDQRRRESVLLRTLGASARQVSIILVIEYATLGALSALTGLILAVAANAGLARFIFEASPWPDVRLLVMAFFAATAVAVVAGLALSRGISRHPPLVILRQG